MISVRAAAAALAGGVIAIGIGLPTPTASAQAAPFPALTTAESWYRTTPVSLPEDGLTVCDLPVGGCTPPVPEVALPSPYAEGTLHVGYSGAAEDSRTYLELNLSSLPLGSAPVGGTLTLPVATDPQAGTLLPETAAMTACLVSASIPDAVNGAITGAPEADCETSSPAKFVAASGAQSARFTVDLAPFAESWAVGTAAVALVPAPEQAEGASWHVAFSRRDRAAAGAEPITASLLLEEAGDEGESPLPEVDKATGGTADAPARAFDGESLALDSGASFAAPPVVADAAPPVAVDLPQTAALPVTPAAVMLGSSYSYPGVFLLPLVLAAAVGWVGRALTRDLAPPVG